MKLLFGLSMFLSFYAGAQQTGTVEECKKLCQNRGNTYAYGTWSPGPCSCALQGQGCKSQILTLTDSKKGIIQNITDDAVAKNKKGKNCD